VIAPAVVIAGALSVALAVINLPLFALLAVALPVFAVLTRRFEGVVGRRTRAWQEAFDSFSTRADRALRARPLIAAQAAEDRELEAARGEVFELSAAGRSMAYAQAAYAQLQGAVASVAGIVVLVVGGAAVARGSMSLGSLISFYTLVALLRTQAGTILGTLPQLMSGRESLRRLEAILDAPDALPYSGRRKPSLRRALALHEVEFGYRPHEPVLRGVDLELARGECVALVGRNGAGKSTVGALLLGMYRPWSGCVSADGVPYDELEVRALRRRLGFVAQTPILLPGTVEENIAYGADVPGAAAVRAAARVAMVDEVLAALPRGYATAVGDDGALLSGGERQRIAIARALVRQPEALILDEPTSSLDRDAVATILANLRELPQQPAILVISHDATIVEGADRVVVLADGSVRAPAGTFP
jgi:ATP-binding cassette, subfamily B, bacterial